MVALSVSTSANTSSLFTVSPRALFHATIFPSVMVSLSNGILISLAPWGKATFATVVGDDLVTATSTCSVDAGAVAAVSPSNNDL